MAADPAPGQVATPLAAVEARAGATIRNVSRGAILVGEIGWALGPGSIGIFLGPILRTVFCELAAARIAPGHRLPAARGTADRACLGPAREVARPRRRRASRCRSGSRTGPRNGTF